MSTEFPPLLPGDIVRVVAPAGKGSQANIIPILDYISSLGLNPVIKPDIYDPLEPFYSNTDEYRSADLISAILDPNCKVIWCIRGGAGCNRLISSLETSLPSTAPLPPKILIGYSDITVLHLYLGKKYNWPTIHGLMLEAIAGGSFPTDSPSVTTLQDLIFNRSAMICEPIMMKLDSRGDIGVIRGKAIGGNMTLVENSIGTLWQMDARGKIILLEDTGEAGYKVERSLEHMKQAGLFVGALAIVFGDFTNPDNPDLVNFALQRFADNEPPCPVFKLSGIGHGNVNFPLPLNTSADIFLEDAIQQTYRMCVANLTFTDAK